MSGDCIWWGSFIVTIGAFKVWKTNWYIINNRISNSYHILAQLLRAIYRRPPSGGGRGGTKNWEFGVTLKPELGLEGESKNG